MLKTYVKLDVQRTYLKFTLNSRDGERLQLILLHKSNTHFHIFKAIMRKSFNDNLKCSSEISRIILERSKWVFNVRENSNSTEADFSGTLSAKVSQHLYKQLPECHCKGYQVLEVTASMEKDRSPIWYHTNNAKGGFYRPYLIWGKNIWHSQTFYE